MVEGSMTQGAGQGPAMRTETLRDFRVPVTEPAAPYAVSTGLPDEAPVYGEYPAYYEDGARAAVPPQPGYLPQPPAAPGPQPDPHREQAHEQHREQHRDPRHDSRQDPRQDPRHEGPPHGRPQGPPQPAAHTEAEPVHSMTKGPEEDEPEGYTPTYRDLPVIGRTPLGGPGDTVQVQYVPQDAAGPGPLYVVGDVHGYLDELVTELRAQGLIDAEGRWSAGNARLWFLGDFTDRGPDGIGVIDLVMRLSAEAAAAGGYCKALMGNHELLLIGAKRFGDTPVVSGAGTATFQAAWLLNGGQRTDMERLQDVHIQWMSRLDAAVLEEDHLLLHSDTTAYLDYGDSIEDVNDTIHELLNRGDVDITWDLFRKFTKRFAFRDEETGPQAVRELLDTYGGSRVVHGHSPIPYLLGEVGTEDGDESRGPEAVDGPHVYADGLAIAMDGGVTMAGKLLVVRLPLSD
ncbi:serine/threonine protein phosphatase [Streptomyces yangpuensis]|uniref:Serine/threonine protein phosphatase n=2 Tax=Streptomyces TaxID=1883 RepID=A0ABY5Q781_9ACTN|nr:MULTISPECIES: metallophosphoesterase family protein [Streptomyces]MBZ9596869.1 serine/threonine protein phosphatase [Streptomyces erythrochromogenes]UUY52037.1 serine/threonine protein phosphatase [Streptomyces yangpuensis]